MRRRSVFTYIVELSRLGSHLRARVPRVEESDVGGTEPNKYSCCYYYSIPKILVVHIFTTETRRTQREERQRRLSNLIHDIKYYWFTLNQ